MLQGDFTALTILPLLATISIFGKYVRVRILDIDPWPVEEQGSNPLKNEKDINDNPAERPESP